MKLFDPFDPNVTVNSMFSNEEIDQLYVFNYMVDVAYLNILLKQFKIHNITIIAQKIYNNKGYRVVNPILPFAYGTHHTKMFVAFYKSTCTITIHTANILAVEWKYKTQGYQIITGHLSQNNSIFKSDFISYINAYKTLPDLTALLRMFHFDTHKSIVASVPGKFKNNKFGLLRIKSLLSNEQYDTLIIQVSSIPRLGSKYKNSAIESLVNAFNCKDYCLIYPSSQSVENGHGGSDAGSSLPHQKKYYKNHKQWLFPHLYHWKSDDATLELCMPHIKTFALLKNGDISKVLMSSHNISNAAWGSVKDGEIFIKSYELGILEEGDKVPFTVPLTPYEEGDDMWTSS